MKSNARMVDYTTDDVMANKPQFYQLTYHFKMKTTILFSKDTNTSNEPLQYCINPQD